MDRTTLVDMFVECCMLRVRSARDMQLETGMSVDGV